MTPEQDMAEIAFGKTPAAASGVLTDEQIWANDAIMAVNAEAGLPFDVLARLVRAALAAPAAPSAGWKLVPVEPTQNMRAAGGAALEHTNEVSTWDDAANIYRAMVGAASSHSSEAPRFPMTYCSQCGKELGPGNAGVSHCSDHAAPAAPGASAPSVGVAPAGEVVSASLDHATVRWHKPTSQKAGGDPRNSWSWPITGDKVYLAPLPAAPVGEPTHSWEEEQARFFGVPVESIPASIAPPAAAQDEASTALDDFERAWTGFHLDHNDVVAWIGKIRAALAAAPAAPVAPEPGDDEIQAIDDRGPLIEGWRVAHENGRNGWGVYAYYKNVHDSEDCAFLLATLPAPAGMAVTEAAAQDEALLPALPTAAYSLDLNDGHPVVAYSVQQMYNFARAALAARTQGERNG